MTSNDSNGHRLKFYGSHDFGTYAQMERAAVILERFDPLLNYSLCDLIELYNASLITRGGSLPDSFLDTRRATVQATISNVNSLVGKFFNDIDQSNLHLKVVTVDRQYRSDLLTLFERHKVF